MQQIIELTVECFRVEHPSALVIPGASIRRLGVIRLRELGEFGEPGVIAADIYQIPGLDYLYKIRFGDVPASIYALHPVVTAGLAQIVPAGLLQISHDSVAEGADLVSDP